MITCIMSYKCTFITVINFYCILTLLWNVRVTCDKVTLYVALYKFSIFNFLPLASSLSLCTVSVKVSFSSNSLSKKAFLSMALNKRHLYYWLIGIALKNPRRFSSKVLYFYYSFIWFPGLQIMFETLEPMQATNFGCYKE